MNDVGRYVQQSEHHPLLRYGYHLKEDLESYPPERAIRENIIRARSFLTRPDLQNVFEREWDVLIVLDAARQDEVLNVGFDQLDFRSNTEFRSVASCTWQWIPRTFFTQHTPDLSQVAYVSANPHTDSLADSQFGLLDEVWQRAWSDGLGTVEPRAVTDQAIRAGRQYSFDRMIVHYLQPHAPYLTEQWREIQIGGFNDDRNVWQHVRQGNVELSEVTEAYRETLEIVMSEVELLLENIDAETAIVSADHGEAFGEKGIYGHPADMYVESLINVPWIETTAKDEHTHTPEIHESESDTTVEERLDALGYQ